MVRNYSFNTKLMNALTVRNPHHKCDFGNKNDSLVTDMKITSDSNDNYYNYYTKSILYMYVWVKTYTPSPTKSTQQGSNLEEIRKQFRGFNHVDEKWKGWS